MSISQNIKKVRELITQTELSSNRQPNSVLLLAVSKEQSPELIREAFEQGISHFGENYFQEAHEKILALKDLPICWHFIGPIQSNKTKGIAKYFNWVHSIDRNKTAKLLNQFRSEQLPPLNVCLQINLAGETTKSGIPPEHAIDLALEVKQLPNLQLRGLMTIPPQQSNMQTQYDLFLKLNQLKEFINKTLHLKMDTLSMGMSDDLVPAIKAGSTIVRIGRAIFGERKGKL
ncbi:TPA: YggS family pyridoxal phosphate-dependent enzyme [Legionella pneumophila]|uniref:YggS family pyridoxal phosphate-dependent enzyme n=1 Tax=Legionella pneumophila TaxID=446 RepID=UPI00048680E1|nr:YggS family pyridoxal phosphate-dependent enzyme [Legionella pneumophila]MCZ4701464.1 YggS family pyridoxal phosphate-dependent enzyme [Legionella pneumophila]MCZ4732271.1 YggS family pyridoxal phosphate-dependent enzyme [Legionella pneumophila]MCZ4753806.1 YggS family pyridoxal phosphate-dependent enzyme [Legionella pneumophila]MDW9052300.1 YggS family pyridoxal phosphate-dependent enzyme [Legionella pneumophila]MDW9061553.1 YggS family pyridoxal phosphate-dependent enzyme [Legionella pneu